MKVAFQGERGAFSEIMINKLFKNPEIHPCQSYKQAFANVITKISNVAVIPVENSLTGRISEPTNLLINSNVQIIREGYLEIIHNLISRKENLIKDIKRIYGHPEILNHCRKYLESLNADIISWYDGAGAVKKVKEEKAAALVGSEKIGELYDLKVLIKGIQDPKENITRFFVISHQSPSPTTNDKTTLIFYTDHKPGTLYNALKSFAENQINLTRLESIPLKEKSWQYMFLLDLEGHKEDQSVKKSIEGLKKCSQSVKILGSYPKGQIFK